jgi:hypothetical protein
MHGRTRLDIPPASTLQFVGMKLDLGTPLKPESKLLVGDRIEEIDAPAGAVPLQA